MSRGLNAVSEAFPPQQIKNKKNKKIKTYPGGNTGLKCLWICHLLSYKIMYKWEADHYGLKKIPNKTWNSTLISYVPLCSSAALGHFQYLCCSRLTPCAPSDCDAWGHKSTASCLDFNMVLSMLALCLFVYFNYSSPLPTIPLLYFLCLSLLTNFVDKLCFSFVNMFSFFRICFSLSSLGAIFVAIKYKAVVLLEILCSVSCFIPTSVTNRATLSLMVATKNWERPSEPGGLGTGIL